MAIAFPTIELSDSIRGQTGLGYKGYNFKENYAASGLKGHNARRQIWTWVWQELTHAQIGELRDYFIALEDDVILWTPPAQSTELKWRVISPSLDESFSDHDNAGIRITVAQDFRNI